MIIFDTSVYSCQLAILMLTCRHCDTPAAHMVTKYVTKFTLFFVPLFPVSRSYALQCTFCGMGQAVPKEWVEQSLAQPADPLGSEAHAQPQHPQQPCWHPGT
ncbi:zinc-ribbon domain-containing protein [Streptomyces sp. NPDC001381]|uniref:zinc-ribbon domain-containing protein n=1 Tax=Streptomyces sp. NPDC001381 TaxID=3364567 RepID=UPI0036763204